jgi:hypothetical protein
MLVKDLFIECLFIFTIKIIRIELNIYDLFFSFYITDGKLVNISVVIMLYIIKMY